MTIVFHVCGGYLKMLNIQNCVQNIFLLLTLLQISPFPTFPPSPPPPPPTITTLFSVPMDYAQVHVCSLANLFQYPPTLSSESCQSVPCIHASGSIHSVSFVHQIPHMSEIIWYLSFSDWLILLSIILRHLRNQNLYFVTCVCGYTHIVRVREFSQLYLYNCILYFFQSQSL